jgi:hypothetical protein
MSKTSHHGGPTIPRYPQLPWHPAGAVDHAAGRGGGVAALAELAAGATGCRRQPRGDWGESFTFWIGMEIG